MLTIEGIVQAERARAARHQPTEAELRSISLDRPARLFGRLSEAIQMRDSIQSMAELGQLVRLVRQDGFATELSDEEVRRRLDAIQRREADALRYWIDGQLVVDLRDLGLSGRLGPDRRPGLAELMADLSRGEAPEVTGIIYLSSEGVSRLSRDQDRVIGYQLLKLMKRANCRVRTPTGVLNPRLDRDWRDLAEGFEDAARQSKHLLEQHFGPRKRAKAEKGEHVGNQVPPGFIVEIKGYKSSGSYIFGKWAPYPPHAEIDVKILEAYVRCNGSKYRAAQALRGLVFPFFPQELKYMETRTSLRHSLKTDQGYLITPEVVDGVASQVALIGMWKWTDIFIENNHPSVVPVELFREAYELHSRRGGRPRGRAAYFEPLEWDGLLRCLNHGKPHHISGHSSEGRWVCDRDYHNGIGPVCLDIGHHIISEPLTAEFLRCLDLGSHAGAVWDEIQSRASTTEQEEARRKREEAQLKNRLANLEGYLGSCDAELEESYWRQIKQVRMELQALQQKPRPVPVSSVDIGRVRRFLENLDQEWQRLPTTLRNRLLKLLVERVDIVHDAAHIRATVIWKMGFSQEIDIARPVVNSRRDRWWTDEHDGLLKMMWHTADKEALRAVPPGRSWGGIRARAAKLGLGPRERPYPPHWRPWSREDDARLAALYVTARPMEDIAAELGRSDQAVMNRACFLKIERPREATYPRPRPTWEILNMDGLETSRWWVQPTRAS